VKPNASAPSPHATPASRLQAFGALLAALDLTAVELVARLPNVVGQVLKYHALDLTAVELVARLPNVVGQVLKYHALDLTAVELVARLPNVVGQVLKYHALDLTAVELLARLPNVVGQVLKYHALDLTAVELVARLPNVVGQVLKYHALDLTAVELLARLPNVVGQVLKYHALDGVELSVDGLAQPGNARPGAWWVDGPSNGLRRGPSACSLRGDEAAGNGGALVCPAATNISCACSVPSLPAPSFPLCAATGNSADRVPGGGGGGGGGGNPGGGGNNPVMRRGLLQNLASARYETARPGYGFNVITTANGKIMIRGGAAQADFLAAPGSLLEPPPP